MDYQGDFSLDRNINIPFMASNITGVGSKALRNRVRGN